MGVAAPQEESVRGVFVGVAGTVGEQIGLAIIGAAPEAKANITTRKPLGWWWGEDGCHEVVNREPRLPSCTER